MSLQIDPEEIETRYLHDFAALAGAHVLEIGCGDARLTWRYAHATWRVIGVDLDLTRLLATRQSTPAELGAKASFLAADAVFLPFPRAAFDVAILAWSL